MSGSIITGLSACGISALLFGSIFVPIKPHNTFDGIFVQWVMSCSIIMVGFIVFAIEGFPQFYPLAMLGGVSWGLGNAIAVPIMNNILGMALAILLGNTTNCLTGWATSRFGLFGTTARPPKNDVLNYIGLVMVLIGGLLFSQIKNEKMNADEQLAAQQVNENQYIPVDVVPVINSDGNSIQSTNSAAAITEKTKIAPTHNKVTFGHRVHRFINSPAIRRPFGIVMILFTGICAGLTFTPVVYIHDHLADYPGASDRGLPYVFSHYMGIFTTSSIIFIIYCIYSKNQPAINRETALPGLASGTLWALGQASFFVANENLSQTVSFPIITMMPGVIASLWSVFYFHEISGKRNLRILCGAIFVTLCGVVLVGMSKHFEISTII